MFRTIHTYYDGIKSQGHFLICILFLNKRQTQGEPQFPPLVPEQGIGHGKEQHPLINSPKYD